MTLDKLPLGQEAVITAVGGEGALRCRLLDMGLIPKTRVRVEKVAPLATRWSCGCGGTPCPCEGGRRENRSGGGRDMIFALAGNQNCGKTTLFNQLTGSNQHVATSRASRSTARTAPSATIPRPR